MRIDLIAQLLRYYATPRCGVNLRKIRVEGVASRQASKLTLELIQEGDLNVMSSYDVNGEPFQGSVVGLSDQGRLLLNAISTMTRGETLVRWPAGSPPQAIGEPSVGLGRMDDHVSPSPAWAATGRDSAARELRADRGLPTDRALVDVISRASGHRVMQPPVQMAN